MSTASARKTRPSKAPNLRVERGRAPKELTDKEQMALGATAILASGTAYGLTVVVAGEQTRNKNGGYGGQVTVRLETGIAPDDVQDTQLIIEAEDVVGDDRGGRRDTAISLYHPDAVRALTAALLQLTLYPSAQRILADIKPRE